MIPRKQRGDIIVLYPQGKLLDCGISDQIRQLIKIKTIKIVCVLSQVTSVNSTDLGSLMAAMAELCDVGGDLKIVRGGFKDKNLLTDTNLETVFDVYDSVDAAIAAFQKNKQAPI